MQNCFIFYTDEDKIIRKSCYWILIFLSELEDQKILDEILTSKILYDIVNCKKIDQISIVPSLRIVGNLLSNNDNIVEYLINYNILEFLKNILKYEDYQMIREGLWALSNITAGSKKHIILILNNEDLVFILKKYLFKDDYEIRSEILINIGNILLNADYEIASKLIKLKFEEDVIAFLGENKDAFQLDLALEIVKLFVELPYFKLNPNFSNGKINYFNLNF